MKTLALESSAKAASCALLDGDTVVGEFFLHTGQTHSQTLLPMVEQLLTLGGVTPAQLELLAVAAGPGSFTGLRIAMAAVKGLAMARDIPCCGVSTLEALAWNLRGAQGLAGAVMDARRDQVYAALFWLDGAGGVRRLTQDDAIPIEELGRQLAQHRGDQKNSVWLLGDGAMLCYNALLKDLPEVRPAPAHLRLQRASSVGALAQQAAAAGEAVSCRELTPRYLRLPQAQRELLSRQGTPPQQDAEK